MLDNLLLSENTPFLSEVKSYCIADLLFYLLGFSWFAYVESTTDLSVWSHPN